MLKTLLLLFPYSYFPNEQELINHTLFRLFLISRLARVVIIERTKKEREKSICRDEEPREKRRPSADGQLNGPGVGEGKGRAEVSSSKCGAERGGRRRGS